ncbi:PTS lactose/cellobiose transporter subunit IIA [Jejubacter sp. L23]|uniref:PTS lactose/cellobiose transporter subunit IIA n=1 Tax=Jejubacter sp. L23 TaxID=3092086 RepID=UPI003D734F52
MDAEKVCFEMICHVGEARSYFIEAIQHARKKEFSRARELIDSGKQSYNQGHAVHARLIQSEMEQEGNQLSLILIHAEDQMMSAENFKILSEEFLALYIFLYDEK